MATKYKLSEAAKDLSMQNGELIELIQKYLKTEPKKPSTYLTEEELNLIFESVTQAHQVSDFDAYFASASLPKPQPEKEEKKQAKETKKAPEKKAVPKAEAPKAETPKAEAPKAAPAAEKSQLPEKDEKVMKKEIKQPETKPKAEKPKKEQKTENSRLSRFEQKPRFDQNRPKTVPKRENHKPASKTTLPQSANSAPSVSTVSTPVEKERTVRHVDTSKVEINLDKYNERYENIAPQNRMKDNQQRKQKLKQKSANKNKNKFSNKRETEAEKLQRLALERARKQQLKVLIPDEITVLELASRLKVTVSDVIKKLIGLGVMASQNEVIDFDTASLVAMEYNAIIVKEHITTIEEILITDEEDKETDLVERSPVIVVMGHVDHGKTSLLDKIRHTSVTTTEAGGITQHIGAYQVEINGKTLTFLDTPGHEAFTAMRARGANVTDIAILVVAADDGIMPQTVESINHAKAAGVTVIVAINKMDKEGANPDRVKQELTEYELVPEEWGGDTICVPVSALTGQGIEDLLENILLVAEVQELKANPNRLAKGTVVESRLDKGRGPVATMLVQNGTLHTGDIIIAGTSVGRVRQMMNDKGQVVTEAGPSVPVEITGMAEVPNAGDTFNVVENERLARELVEQRRAEEKNKQFESFQKVTLDNLFSQMAEGEMKELPIVVKADVHGTSEAVKQSLEKLSNDEVRVKVIHTGVGAINKSDVMLANASNAIIIGFNVRPDSIAKSDAEENGVEIRMYRIIYDAIEDVQDAMKGMLSPKTREVELGKAEVRQIYRISSVGVIAGCYVQEGKVARDALIRVVRDGIVVAEDKIDSLKRFKNDAKEVLQGYECGIGLDKFNDIKEGDIFESFIIEEYRD